VRDTGCRCDKTLCSEGVLTGSDRRLCMRVLRVCARASGLKINVETNCEITAGTKVRSWQAKLRRGTFCHRLSHATFECVKVDFQGVGSGARCHATENDEQPLGVAENGDFFRGAARSFSDSQKPSAWARFGQRLTNYFLL
jgi:hypothetical protein